MADMPQEINRNAANTTPWLRAAPLLVFALLWQVSAQLLHSKSLPAPSSVLLALWHEAHSGDLFFHLGHTLARVAASFTLAMAVGITLGILMGRSRRVDQALDGLLILSLNIPALVTTILCYLWLGLGEVAAIVAVVINKVPMVAITLREGARAVDPKLMDVARVYRLPRWTTLRRVYLPQLTPYLFSAARNGLALIWKIVLVVELLGRSNGVGFQIGNFFHFFDITSILAYTLAFSVLIFILEAACLRPLENHLNRWRP